MKKLISLILLVLAVNAAATAQCGVNAKELVDKYCEGKILLSKEIKRDIVLSYVFSKGTDYFFYLLNPNNELPDLEIKNSKEGKPDYYSYEMKVDYVNNYAIIKFNS